MSIEQEYRSLKQRVTAIEETLAAAGIVVKAKDDFSALPELIVDSKRAIFNFIVALNSYDVLAFGTCPACQKEFDFSFRAAKTDKDGAERIVTCTNFDCRKKFRTRVWHRAPQV